MAAPPQHDEPSARDTRSPNPHPTVLVTVGDTSAHIDEQLAPLIEGLWRLGIRTRSCCQERSYQLNMMSAERPMFFVMFTDTEHLRQMLTLFVNTTLDPRHRGKGWHYQLFPRFDEPDAPDSDPLIGLHPIVIIPREHLGFVTTTVRGAALRSP